MNRLHVRPIIVAVSLLLAVAGLRAQRSDTEGIKEADNFVKAGDKTSRSIAEAKAKIQDALSAYNALVMQPSSDLRGDYKKLLNTVKEMNQKADAAKENVTTMEKVGNTYFAGRATSIKNIQDLALQEKAQSRFDQNQTEFTSVMKAFQDADDSLAPLRKDLSDQINFLGSDLTPNATTSLKPQAEQLNQHATEVFTKTDQALSKAGAYFNSMRPAKA